MTPSFPLEGLPSERLDALFQVLGFPEPTVDAPLAPPPQWERLQAWISGTASQREREVLADLINLFRPWRDAYKTLLIEHLKSSPKSDTP